MQIYNVFIRYATYIYNNLQKYLLAAQNSKD